MKRLLLLTAPLLALGLVAAPSTLFAPARVEAASCTLVMNLFDANATNGANANPGGTATTLAYPGYTNGEIVSLDVKSTSGSACASQSRSGGWYVMLSRFVGAIFGKKIDWTDAPSSEADNYAQVDQVPGSLLTTTVTDDYKNDFGPGTSTGAAAAFDLTAAGTATLSSGSTVTVYGDITTCDVAQSSTPGFAPGYARRKGGNLGVWYWLNNTVGNTNSAYLASAGGSEATGGGGKGTCSSMLPTHSTDTIIFDDSEPSISSLSTTAGGTGVKALVVDLDSSKVSDAGSGAWLMAFTNSSGCSGGSGSWSAWEAYATTKKGWDLASTTYGGKGGSAEGSYPACMRVIDKAGNIAVEQTTFVYDKTAPTAGTFTSAITSTYGISTYDYTLTFSESVSGLAGSDFANAGTATNCVFTPSASSGTTFTITVTGCSATGTLQPRLAAGAITDAGGNTGPAAALTSTTTLTLGQKPALATLALAAASDSGSSTSDRITKAASLTYNLTFDESVTGLAAADFTTAGTATGCVVGTPTGSAAAYTVVLTGCTEGTMTLTLSAGAVLDADRLANSATNAETVTIDRTGPVITTLCTVEDAAALHPVCTPGVKEPVRISIAAGDAGAGLAPSALPYPTAFATCERTDPVLPAGASLVVGALCRGEGVYAPTTTLEDLAGNSATKAFSVAIDLTAPQITIICSTTRYGTYKACPTGTVKLTRYVKVIATDAASGFAANAFSVTSLKTCERIKYSFAAGQKQWAIYVCSAKRTYTFQTSVADQAGNGPVTLNASWRKR